MSAEPAIPANRHVIRRSLPRCCLRFPATAATAAITKQAITSHPLPCKPLAISLVNGNTCQGRKRENIPSAEAISKINLCWLMLINYKYDLNLLYGNPPFMIGVSVPGQRLPSRPATQSILPEGIPGPFPPGRAGFPVRQHGFLVVQ